MGELCLLGAKRQFCRLDCRGVKRRYVSVWTEEGKINNTGDVLCTVELLKVMHPRICTIYSGSDGIKSVSEQRLMLLISSEAVCFLHPALLL